MVYWLISRERCGAIASSPEAREPGVTRKSRRKSLESLKTDSLICEPIVWNGQEAAKAILEGGALGNGAPFQRGETARRLCEPSAG